jgi:ABC-type amino acid transport substrate-binding protein
VTRGRAAAALAGGLGLVAGVIGCTVVAAAVLVALGLPSTGRADDGRAPVLVAAPERPSELVVGLRLTDPRLQAGVVKDGEVVLARGLEVDVARALAARLRMRAVRFVDLNAPVRAFARSSSSWHVAVVAVEPTRRLSVARASLSATYLPLGQAVVQRRGQRPLRTRAELKGQRVCAVKHSGGARALRGLAGLRSPPLVVQREERLFQLVQTGLCDAALVDVIDVSAFVAGRRGLVGPIAARLDTGDGLAVAVASDGGVSVAAVDRILRRLRADGTLARLTRGWLRVDPAALPPLR